MLTSFDKALCSPDDGRIRTRYVFYQNSLSALPEADASLEQRQNAPPTPAAATAAAQAFLANRVSNANLSAAAAAAALRSHTTTPTPVSEMKTKRMLQRQGSTSSNGSAHGNARRPGTLQRQNSSGSMTERTFREPSPNRRPPSRIQNETPPPLPNLPKEYASPPPVPTRSNRRPASVEPPERFSSPPPRIPGGRGVSLDRGPGVMPGRLNREAALHNSKSGDCRETEQFTRRGSVNFSRPMSPSASPTSPVLDTSRFPTLPENTKTTSIDFQRPTSPLAAIGHDLSSSQPRNPISPKKRKEKVLINSTAAGSSELGESQANVAGEYPNAAKITPMIRSVPKLPEIVQDEQTAAKPKKKKKRPVVQPDSVSIQGMRSISQNDYGSDSDTSDRPRTFNTRAAGLLAKQPSIVREDRDAEEEWERVDAPRRTKGGLMGNGKMHVTNPMQYEDAQHLKDPLTDGHPIPEQDRGQSTRKLDIDSGQQLQLRPPSSRGSLSPSRTARFSPQPPFQAQDSIRHQPPQRAISPAKSAMKHSPSSRGSSPAGMFAGNLNRQGLASSEASDTTSIVSEEGYKATSKKKKNVRVSFEDDTMVMGQAATPPTSVDSPVLIGTQSKDSAKKGWFGLPKDKKKSPLNSDNEDDGAMKPRPILPSFGSVRGRKEMETSSTSISPISSEKTQTVATEKEPKSSGVSSDHAIGSIISQQITHPDRINSVPDPHNEPLSPEVNSVEGSGHRSAHGDMVHSHDGDQRESNAESANPNLGNEPEPGHQPQLVPTISVLPATPRVGELSQENPEWLEMPGGFPSAPQTSTSTMEPDTGHESFDFTPSTIGIAEPEPEAVAAHHSSTSPVLGEISQSLRRHTAAHEGSESEDTGDSIYSDAAEDISDLEGDGYGSINAIVESPTMTLSQSLLPLSPLVETLEPEPEPAEGWEKAQAYWSGLSQTRKAEMEDAASSPSAQNTAVEPITKPKKKKKKKAGTTEDIPDSTPTAITRSSLKLPIDRSEANKSSIKIKPSMYERLNEVPKPGTQPTSMRKSMRGPGASESPSSVHVRSSLRNSGGERLSSLRSSHAEPTVSATGSPEPRGALQKKLRPVSAVAMVDYNRTSIGDKHKRATSDGATLKSLTPISSKPVTKSNGTFAKPQRKLSNGSDSSSSFKRSRSMNTDTGRYTMRRSMRTSSVEERPGSVQLNQPSLRSFRPSSPSAVPSQRPFSSGGMGMRSSMREPIETRNSRSAKSPTRSFGLRIGSKTKSAVEKPSGQKFPSRFGDSSDDEDMPKAYRSRFAESSDEDEPTKPMKNLTPVRGIPRKIDEGDSTDLQDSSEEAVPKLQQQQGSSKGNKPDSATLATGSFRPKMAATAPPATPTTNGGPPKAAETAPEKKKRSFFGSLARKKDDVKVTKSENDTLDRRIVLPEKSRGYGASTDASVPSPKSPKLQRRNTPKSIPSSAWPLPDVPIPTGTVNRPNTSDGVALAAARPDIGSRRLTAQPDPANGVLGRSGKKKRFPMLRKAFGLHD